MTSRKLILGSLVAAIIGGASLPSLARATVDFNVSIAPPPPRVEVIPAPRAGALWVPGYWDWRHHRYHWVTGRYVRVRHGFHYEPAGWLLRGDRYFYARPGWRRDRDGDGIPDRFDRAPDNPYHR